MNDEATPEPDVEVDPSEAAALEKEAVEESTAYDVEFDGHTYTVLNGQPSPKAMGHIADYIDTDNGIYAVLFVKEMIGRSAWDEWCKNHKTAQIHDMLMALNKGYSGNSGPSQSG